MLTGPLGDPERQTRRQQEKGGVQQGGCWRIMNTRSIRYKLLGVDRSVEWLETRRGGSNQLIIGSSVMPVPEHCGAGSDVGGC
jgi:hypothetical protein